METVVLKSDRDSEENHDISIDRLKSLVLPKMNVAVNERLDTERQKELAETVYKYLVDNKTKIVSKIGKKICQDIKIDFETIIPKRLEAFE